MTRKFFIQSSVAIGICLLFGFLGSVATQSGMNGWYESLNKSWFNPPDWIFGTVWFLMYILMGIAAGIVWNKGFYHKWVKTALYHFMFQLLFNGFWALLFFGLHKPFWSLLAVIILFILVLLTIKWFKIVNLKAAYLLVPYAIWVLLVLTFNLQIWMLN